MLWSDRRRRDLNDRGGIADGIVNWLSPSLTWLANIVFGGGLIAGSVFFLWQPISGMKEMAQSETAIKYLCSVCKKTWYITESGTLREQ